MSSILTWSTTNLFNFPTDTGRPGAYGNGTIVIPNSSNRTLYYSTNNGTSWTTITVGTIRNVKFLNNIFVAYRLTNRLLIIIYR